MDSSSVNVNTQIATRDLLGQLTGNQRLVKMFENLALDVSIKIPTAMDQLQEEGQGTRALAVIVNAIATEALAIAREAYERPMTPQTAVAVDEAPVQAVIASEAYPVGAVFISTVSTDPALLLGYGVWASFGAGEFLVGYAPGDPDFGTPGGTGGAKTLAVADHAHHIHGVSTTAVQSGTGTTVVTAILNETTNLTHVQATSGLSPMPIIPPFVTVYFFKRTA